MNIPIVIISFNNHKYINNTIKQLENINSNILNDIIIMDNNSNDINTINFLNTTRYKVIRNAVNKGPWVEHYTDFYNSLPNKFFITDPDLQFNENLPKNFTEILSNLSNKYDSYKIGFALDINDSDQMYSAVYYNDLTICNWEKQFWANKIDDANYELYDANIDTTFCLINKQTVNRSSRNIRVAGNFTAKHLPWYIKNSFYNLYEKYIYGINNYSTISKLFLSHININYNITSKNNEKFIIDNKILDNLHFWQKIYPTWESDTFSTFDKYLKKDKIFIDIGAWIGTTSMYGSRKSKHVYAVEADILSVKDLSLNLSNNCINNNYTVINKAVYHKDGEDINFGKNLFMSDSKMNDSTSQIHTSKNSQHSIQVKTITIENIISNYKIDLNNISLIKVDIEGGEENILNNLYKLHTEYRIPLYISIHYNWWKDKNLNRFTFLTEEQKHIIKDNPFINLLFDDAGLKYTLNNYFLLNKKSTFKKLIKKIISKMHIF